MAAEFQAHNRSHLAQQKRRLQGFFETVEKTPLTEEQIEACIRMDDAVQVVAAAGSGKTSMMVAKTGYVLREGLATPEQIVLMAFNVDAARELRRRVHERLRDIPGIENVTIETFSAFGLQVIAATTGTKPSVAPWLNAGADQGKILEIIERLSKADAGFRKKWDLYRTIYARDTGDWNEAQQPEFAVNGRRGFLTANGEVVKSKEERRIADWLFYHSVAYEYERAYEHDTATREFSQYHPDFYYPEAGLYHEHFALDQRGRAPDHFAGDYVAGVEWKRALHREKGTPLLETTSAEIKEGGTFVRLERELTGRGIPVRFAPERRGKGAEPVSGRELAATIRAFQQHAKSNSLSIDQLRAAANTADRGHTDRSAIFLDIYEHVSAAWEQELKQGGFVDFDDMLLLAAASIERGYFKSPFTVILGDEFQDSSRARIRLLKALQNQKKGAHICVVGDDWQGINRFAGADLSVMTEFGKTFPHATTLTLARTFRCPQSLSDVSGAFVQANPAQIRKKVTSARAFSGKSLMAFGFQSQENAEHHLVSQLEQLFELTRIGKVKPTGAGKINVLLLGRYRNDEPSSLTRWQRRFSEHIDLRFRTVHAAKGLEAEYVMILNVVEGHRGFPSQIDDDPVLQLAMPAPDVYPMAEERRLFYVALTRASRQVRIYTSLDRPSRFVSELVKKGLLAVEPIDGELREACPKCAIGVVRPVSGKFGRFRACNNYPACDFKQGVSLPGQNGTKSV